jgi:hypothetical protein
LFLLVGPCFPFEKPEAASEAVIKTTALAIATKFAR